MPAILLAIGVWAAQRRLWGAAEARGPGLEEGEMRSKRERWQGERRKEGRKEREKEAEQEKKEANKKREEHEEKRRKKFAPGGKLLLTRLPQ